MKSLESLGFPKHYIGLRWYNIVESERNAHIKKLQNKHEETNGVLVNGLDVEGNNVLSIGFADELSSRYYSAAAIVSKAISENYPSAFFVQELEDGTYWYLLIKDHVPVGVNNDVILDDIDAVVSLMNEHYQMFDLDEVKLRYVVPREITERVSAVFEEDLSLYQDVDYKTINDAVDDTRFAQIKTVESLLNTNPLTRIPKKALLVTSVLLAALIGVNHLRNNSDTEELVYDLDAIAASALEKSNKRIVGNSSRAKPNVNVLASDALSASEEEAKWLSQRLVASNPKQVISQFVKYVEALPVNVKGWYPEKIDLRLKAIITKEFSTVEDFADIEMFHQIKVFWRNGGASVADFRDSTEFEGEVLYLLHGEMIETTSLKPLPLPKQNFEPLDAITFISDTKGKYLDILSFVQNESRTSGGKFTGNINTSIRKKRETPFKNLIYEYSIEQPEIDYTTLELNLATSGYGWSFKNLPRLAKQLDEFPHLMVTKISLNLETEEMTMTLHYIHDKTILNREEEEKTL